MEQLPVVDVGPIVSSSRGAEYRRASNQVFGSLRDCGFMYIENHGVDADLMRRMSSLAQEFFSQASEDKLKVRMENAGRAWKGFFPVGAELTSGRPDRKEGLYFGSELSADHPMVVSGAPMHGPNQWPAPRASEFKSVVLEYMNRLSHLAKTLMGSLASELGLEHGYFSERFADEPTTLFRIFNYPVHEWQDSEDEWGVREHTDMGFLTILLQDNSGGLQVRGSNGNWIDAPPVDNTFVVNIGDMLELWTWGILKATLHRVRNLAPHDRLSFPFFYDPNWNAGLARIDRSQLPMELLDRASSGASERWDQIDLSRLNKNTTYGEFVWSKVSRVFPHLV